MNMSQLLTDKVMLEMIDNVQLCPVCHKHISKHIITSNWKEIGICSCGWKSSNDISVGLHQPRFYKVSQIPDKNSCIELVETISLK